MIEEEGKCRAEAEARGLPEDRQGMWRRPREEEEEQEEKHKKNAKVITTTLDTKIYYIHICVIYICFYQMQKRRILFRALK